MTRPRKDIKIKIALPPDVHDWLEGATLDHGGPGMTRNDMLVQALRYYMTQPEGALDYGVRVCCGTDPAGGHRGTCRYGAMRGGPDSAEYQALKQMWQNDLQP